jgi:hypothetical protein
MIGDLPEIGLLLGWPTALPNVDNWAQKRNGQCWLEADGLHGGHREKGDASGQAAATSAFTAHSRMSASDPISDIRR